MSFSAPARRLSGNSLIEYLLPAAIFGVVLLIGIVAIIPVFRDSVTSSYGTSKGIQADGSMPTKVYGENPYLEDISLVLADGTTLSLDDYPLNLGKTVEVDGGNGATKALSDALMQLAKKLKEQGKITEEQFNRLADLANRGYRLADIMRQFEDAAAQSGGDVEKYRNTLLQVDGKSIKPYDLALTLGNGSFTPEDFDPLKGNDIGNLLTNTDIDLEEYRRPVGGIGEEQLNFLVDFRKVLGNGSLNDPAVRSLVTDLASKIVLTTRAVAKTGHDTDVYGTTESVNAFEGRLASLTTGDSSSSICQAGGTTSTGVFCPGKS